MTSASRQKRQLQFEPDLVSGGDDEAVPRVQDSKARQTCLAEQYSGHGALPADCKCPWHPAVKARIFINAASSGPAESTWRAPYRQQSATIRVSFHASSENGLGSGALFVSVSCSRATPKGVSPMLKILAAGYNRRHRFPNTSEPRCEPLRRGFF